MLPSSEHEYKVASWYAAHKTSASACEMVGEEPEHRTVWGLARGAEAVVVQMGGGESVQAHVRTIEGHTVVGLMDTPAVLLELVLTQHGGKDKVAGHALVDRFLREAADAFRTHFTPSGLNIHYTRKHYEDVNWRFFGVLPLRRIGTIFMDAGLEQDILGDARRFLGEEATYAKFGRPYKRVYCLHGPPGTGKTSLVTAVASELGRPLAIFNTDSLRDDTFIELLTSRPKDAVLMFEDVDALFRKRDMKAAVGGMTFSTMLNALDGVLHPRGGLIFLTTNHLDQLDAAVHRPGRVDRLVEVTYATPSAATAMWHAAFPRHPVPPSLLSNKTQVVPAHLSELLFQNRDKGAAAVAALVAAAHGPRPKT